MATFTKAIWASKKELFEQKIRHLNKILANCGKNPITFHYENERIEKVEFQIHQKGDAFANDIIEEHLVKMCDAVCEGLTEVKRDDKVYTYIGSVRFEDGIKQVFCQDEKYANFFQDDFRKGYCDHCKTIRSRKSYYLFECEGKVIQIGKQCAKEYFGIDSDAFLSCQENTFLLKYGDDDFGGAYGSGSMFFSFSEIYDALSYATTGFMKWNKRDGFFDPRMPLQDWATVEAVEYCLKSDSWRFSHEPTNCQFNLTREECQEYWSHKDGLFAYNCRSALDYDCANRLSLGAYCYAIFGAVNAKIKAMTAAATIDWKPCKHAVGERVNVKGEIVTFREYTVEECYDGYHEREVTKYSINFKDEDGALYHFNTGSLTFSEIGIGDKVEIRGKICEAKEWNGVPYTRFDRPKLVHDFTQEAASEKAEAEKEVA